MPHPDHAHFFAKSNHLPLQLWSFRYANQETKVGIIRLSSTKSSDLHDVGVRILKLSKVTGWQRGAYEQENMRVMIFRSIPVKASIPK